MDDTKKEFDRIDREFEDSIAELHRAELKYEIAKFIIGIIALGFLLAFIAACDKNGTPTPVAGAIDSFEVTYLFTVDGCKVYRFEDGYKHYLTTCTGSVSTQQHCGKNCTYPDETQTVRPNE